MSAEQDRRFERALRSGFEALAQEKSACPLVERLLQLRAGELDAESAAALRQHVTTCGFCDALLARMERLDEHLSKENPGSLQWFLSCRWPAYALALALLYPAWLGLVRKPQPPIVGVSLGQPLAKTLPVFELAQTRGAESQVRVNPSDNSFFVKFFVPMKPGIMYSAVIRERAGASILELHNLRSQDALGNIMLLCDRSYFPRGAYTLTITEMNSGKRQFNYSFQVE